MKCCQYTALQLSKITTEAPLATGLMQHNVWWVKYSTADWKALATKPLPWIPIEALILIFENPTGGLLNPLHTVQSRTVVLNLIAIEQQSEAINKAAAHWLIINQFQVSVFFLFCLIVAGGHQSYMIDHNGANLPPLLHTGYVILKPFFSPCFFLTPPHTSSFHFFILCAF